LRNTGWRSTTLLSYSARATRRAQRVKANGDRTAALS
jgi:hypothetical protein